MANPQQEVAQLRAQGLTDSMIMDELIKKGYNADQVHTALSFEMDDMPAFDAPSPTPMMHQSMPSPASTAASGMDSNIYERIEEITEGMIDEKWDALISEVRKIVDWKEKIEERQQRMQMTLEKLKEDFNVLHQGVLGKLEDYDTRMRDVGTELKAVGKVFKDVVPQFVENVKELSAVTSMVKESKEKK